MAYFLKKTLSPGKRVCLRLKEAREKAHVNLADLAKQAKINKKHLEALEECRFNDIPYAAIYQKNFIRRYLQCLELPAEDFLNQFIIEEAEIGGKKKDGENKKIKKNRLYNLPALLRTTLIILVVFSLIGYLGWQVRSIIKPPELSLYSPENGYVTTQYEILVHGQTNQESQVYVNGKEIPSEADGQFKQIINLSPGINTITISAKKKHGKSTSLVRHVTLKTNSISYNELILSYRH